MRLVLALFLSLAVSNAAVYYVRTDGNNSNTGLANNSGGAWLTIQKAATTMVAGDTVRVQAGTYDERVALGASGTSASKIIYVCDGSVVCRGFDMGSTHHIRVIGFEIVHTGAANLYPAFLLNNTANNNELIDNYIHDVNGIGVRIGDGSSVGNSNVIRGNIITNVGYITGTNYDGSPVIQCLGTNNLIEYNSLARGSDFVTASFKDYRNIVRNNFLHDVQTNYFLNSSPHVDMWESQPGTTNVANGSMQNLFERNMSVSNMTPNSHSTLLQSTSQSTNDSGVNVHDFISRLNVIQHLGSAALDVEGFPRLKCYNNTLSHIVELLANGNANNGNGSVVKGATNCSILNNIYYSSGAAQSFSYNVDATTSGTITIDGDCVFGGMYLDPSETHGMTNNPNFIDEPNNNFRVSPGSPVIGAAQSQTLTVGTGTATNVVVVSDSRMFMDGWSMVTGDSIVVSGNSATVTTNVDYDNNLIYFINNLTWTNAAPVRLIGTADLGALPYGSTELTSAIISQSGNTYTVTPIGDARGVWFYVDGIPTTWTTTSPFQATIASGSVTAKAYALYAQATPVVTAVASIPSRINVSRANIGRITAAP